MWNRIVCALDWMGRLQLIWLFGSGAMTALWAWFLEAPAWAIFGVSLIGAFVGLLGINIWQNYQAEVKAGKTLQLIDVLGRPYETHRGKAALLRYISPRISLVIILVLVVVGVIAYAVLQNKQTTLTAVGETVKPSNEPATYMEVTNIIHRPDLFEIEPANTTKVDVNFTNKGPLHAKDVTFGFVLAIRLPSITKTQEDEMFYELLKNHKGSPKADMGVGVSGWKTIATSRLSKKETDDLQNETTRLYSLGFIHYRDKNGQQTHEFCRWLQPPSVWHLCDGGHNRMVSGDTPY